LHLLIPQERESDGELLGVQKQVQKEKRSSHFHIL